MTVQPEPDAQAAPRDPAEYRRPRLMGVGFWMLLLLCALCVAAGAAFAWFAPRLLAGRPASQTILDSVLPPEPKAAAAKPEVLPLRPALPSAAETAAPAAGDVTQLSERLNALEAQQARTAGAAAAALAGAALVEASQASRPFSEELAAMERAAPAAAGRLAELKRLAVVGAPSRSALAASYPDYAARAASASRAPADGAGFFARVAYALSRVVTVRQVGEVKGDGADAVLARAERLVEDGELDAALRTLDALSPAAREAMAPWRLRAERRAEIDRRVSAVRGEALEALALAARPTP
jgi:hypothetical protein